MAYIEHAKPTFRRVFHESEEFADAFIDVDELDI